MYIQFMTNIQAPRQSGPRTNYWTVTCTLYIDTITNGWSGFLPLNVGVAFKLHARFDEA